MRIEKQKAIIEEIEEKLSTVKGNRISENEKLDDAKKQLDRLENDESIAELTAQQKLGLDERFKSQNQEVKLSNLTDIARKVDNAINAELRRKCFAALESILMDEETLINHRELWCREPKQHAANELPYLTYDEQELYRALKNNTYGQNVRLEQERVRWDIAEKVIKNKTS